MRQRYVRTLTAFVFDTIERMCFPLNRIFHAEWNFSMMIRIQIYPSATHFKFLMNSRFTKLFDIEVKSLEKCRDKKIISWSFTINVAKAKQFVNQKLKCLY